MTDDTRWNDGTEVRPRVSRPVPGSPVEVIKADIERTQAELADTLEALQRKLHPRRLIGDARGAVKDYSSRWARTAFDATIHAAAVGTVYTEHAGQRIRKKIEARPTSSALVAAGLASLAWLWLRRRRGTAVPHDRTMRVGLDVGP